jgi:hypothetical protein
MEIPQGQQQTANSHLQLMANWLLLLAGPLYIASARTTQKTSLHVLLRIDAMLQKRCIVRSPQMTVQKTQRPLLLRQHLVRRIRVYFAEPRDDRLYWFHYSDFRLHNIVYLMETQNDVRY